MHSTRYSDRRFANTMTSLLLSAAIPSRTNLGLLPPGRGLTLRLRVRAARRRLDREIAVGAAPQESPARSVRAAQLAEPRTRRTMATLLETIVDSAQERQHDRSSHLVLEHDAVLEARDGLLELAGLLRSNEPLTPRALALAVVLAEHPHSPLVSPSAAQTVRQALAEIAAAR
jgi:hypothetical protein